MTEVWLRPNRRILAASAVPPALCAIGCGAVAQGYIAPLDDFVLRTIAAVLTAIAVFALAFYAALAWQPRLAYSNGRLRVYLRWLGSIAVPIEWVEAFFLGQGPSSLAGKQHRRTETATLVIRLAERAVDWKKRPVHPMLGNWCDGYITIRGTWCEPLSLELVQRLNLRLHQVNQARKHDKAVGQRA